MGLPLRSVGHADEAMSALLFCLTSCNRCTILSIDQLSSGLKKHGTVGLWDGRRAAALQSSVPSGAGVGTIRASLLPVPSI